MMNTNTNNRSRITISSSTASFLSSTTRIFWIVLQLLVAALLLLAQQPPQNHRVTSFSIVASTRTSRTKSSVTSKSSSSSSALRMATWSDSKAVQEYQQFLSSGKQSIELKKDQPSLIVKSASATTSSSDNQLVNALLYLGNENGITDDVVLTSNQEIPMDASIGNSKEFPVYVCLPPYELHEFLRNLPPGYEQHSDDFVFFSGGLSQGNIEDVLKDNGYCRDTMTQVLISGMQIKPQTGRPIDVHVNLGQDEYGEPKLSGACTACGKWNGAVAERLEAAQIKCQTDFYRDWRRKMFERHVYDAVFTLLASVRNEPTTLAQVAQYYDTEVSDMVWELSGLLRGWKALTLLYGFEDRLFTFAEVRGGSSGDNGQQETFLNPQMYPYIWGNSLFLQSKMFVEYLQYAQLEKGLLQGIELPRGAKSSSIMLKGNLRADGVI